MPTAEDWLSGQVEDDKRTLMLEALGLTSLSVELGPNLIKQLVETSRIARGYAPHAAMRIHGHVEGNVKPHEDATVLG